MNLYELRLGAKDYRGIDITAADGPNRWHLPPSFYLGAGYDGLRIIGEGVGKTRIVPDPAGTERESGLCVNVGLDARHVEFEGISFHAGPQCALRIGAPTRGTWAQPRPSKDLNVELRDFEVVADARPPGSGRSMWGVFAYQADMTLEEGEFHAAELAEHAAYYHGHGERGQTWRRVHVRSSGAEGFKNRSDPSEIGPARRGTPLIHIDECSFADWNQPHSFRGGGGVVCQGTSANIVINQSLFHGGSDLSHSRCFMVDDNGDKGYWGAGTGDLNSGASNGHILVTDSGFTGTAPEWYGEIVRVGSLIDKPFGDLAHSMTVLRSGLYGPYSLLRANDVPKVEVRDCNSAKIRAQAEALGVDTSMETLLAVNMGPLTPASKGYATSAAT